MSLSNCLGSYDLDAQKVILITGCSTGIGLATALDLAGRGARVFASMRDLSEASDRLTSAEAAYAQMRTVQLDVTDQGSVNAAISAVLREAGRIDVVVNNAAVAAMGALEFTTDDEARWIFETNVLGPLRVTRAVLPHMRAAGSGRIVNVSSNGAHPRLGIRLFGLYAMSQAALHAQTLELAKEVTLLGLEVVLVEGGVSGTTAIWNGLVETADSFGSRPSPYRVFEEGSAAFVKWASTGVADPAVSAALIADACLERDPPLRFRLADQSEIDAADQIDDERFKSLARGDLEPGLYEGAPLAWRAQRRLLREMAEERAGRLE